MKETFIYLRTKLSVEFSSEAIQGLASDFPYSFARSELVPAAHINDPFLIETVALGEDALTWEDALVLRFASRRPPLDIATQMEGSLSAFAAWAICNSSGEYTESPVGGLFSRFFSVSSVQPISQIYLMVREGDRRYEANVEELRTAVKGTCLPVFHFRDGQIMFVRTKEPASITARRCGAQLKKFAHWAIVDGSQETQSSNLASEEVWKTEELQSLKFGGRDEDEDEDEDWGD